MSMVTTENKSGPDKLINILSIAIPLAVAVLIGIRTKIDLGAWTKVLPHVIGALNAATSVLLIVSFIAIKSGKREIHRFANLGAFALGSAFLIIYILYHISNPSTSYGGSGFLKPVYYFLLISHILLSIGVVRLVLLSLHYALNNRIQEHKKVAKWAYPIWLYVSVTGVIVYIMIRPYYI
jgi:putative membrane protein